MTFRMGPALLFCPADRGDRYDKAAERSDAVILDLEDAVDPEHRVAAREALLAHSLDPERTIVRVNPVGTEDFAADLAAIAQTRYRTIMVPKLGGLDGLLALKSFDVVALCETAAGVLAAPALAAHPSVVALMWGAEDLLASLGGTSSRSAAGRYRDVSRHARSAVLLAAKASNITAIDTVHLAIDDQAGLAEEATDAAASGFDAVACIHPAQVAVIRTAFRPGETEIAFARALLDAATRESGVFRFRGRMVDRPVLEHAEETVRRAVQNP